MYLEWAAVQQSLMQACAMKSVLDELEWDELPSATHPAYSKARDDKLKGLVESIMRKVLLLQIHSRLTRTLKGIQDAPMACGLHWIDMGTIQPRRSQPLTADKASIDALARMLAEKRTLNEMEWAALGIEDLRPDSYVKTGGSYYRPDDSQLNEHGHFEINSELAKMMEAIEKARFDVEVLRNATEDPETFLLGAATNGLSNDPELSREVLVAMLRGATVHFLPPQLSYSDFEELLRPIEDLERLRGGLRAPEDFVLSLLGADSHLKVEALQQHLSSPEAVLDAAR
eukprot:2018528-Prymnesium_polylepis.1